MGNWIISIEGHGIHDNGRPDDVDQMLAEFAKELRTSGQEINKVTIHTGSRKELADNEWKY